MVCTQILGPGRPESWHCPFLHLWTLVPLSIKWGDGSSTHRVGLFRVKWVINENARAGVRHVEKAG